MLKSENEELHDLAQHVQYMANMIEVCRHNICNCKFFSPNLSLYTNVYIPSVQRLTGMGPDNLEELRDMALEAEDNEQNGDASDQSDSEEEEEPSDHGQAGPSEEEWQLLWWTSIAHVGWFYCCVLPMTVAFVKLY